MTRRIYIKGKECTEDIRSITEITPDKYRIIFRRGGKPYFYNKSNVVIKDVQIPYEHKEVLAYFFEFSQFELSQGSISAPEITEEVSSASAYTKVISELEKIIHKGVETESAFIDYLNGHNRITDTMGKLPLIFPFSCNRSQKLAVERALTNSISVIQGPPGTGKTQTILNIVANLIVRGKSVAIVSNNNSATKNVQEKLASKDYELGWMVAELGNLENQKHFFENLPSIELKPDYKRLKKDSNLLNKLSKDIDLYYAKSVQLKENEKEIHRLEFQKSTFLKEEEKNGRVIQKSYWFGVFSGKADTQLKRYEHLLQKLLSPNSWLEHWGSRGLLYLNGISQHKKLVMEVDEALSAIVLAKSEYLVKKLKNENESITRWLNEHSKDAKNYIDASKDFFFSDIYEKFSDQKKVDYSQSNYHHSDTFLKRFPVVTSSTYALTSSRINNELFDYLIIDEASQVNVPTAAICMNCARNAVIVGDSLQLEKIVSSNAPSPQDPVKPCFDASKNSILDSVIQALGKDLPETLLREHYRSHPDIIEFCNKRFYHGQLVAMTQRTNSTQPFEWINTSENEVLKVNHSFFNPRQHLETVKTIESLINGSDYSPSDIGVISPYREQSKRFKNESFIADTVHRFQGRENDVIIFCPVRNRATAFNDNPHLINVAVSRAKDKFILISPDFGDQQDSNLASLVRYIKHLDPGFTSISESRFRSIFDALYKKKASLPKARKDESPAEALFRLLLKTLRKDNRLGTWDFVQEYPVRLLPRHYQGLGQEHIRFMRNGARLDFLLYDTIDQQPIAAIEVDGATFHKEGSKQSHRDQLKNEILEILGIPLVRFKTNTVKGREEEFLRNFLSELYQKRNQKITKN